MNDNINNINNKIDDSKEAFFKSQKFGILLVLACGIMWGISGILGQYVFSNSGADAADLTVIRLLITGIALLIFALADGNKKALTIWAEPRDAASLVFFSITGIMGVQLTYFASIEASNAATGTVIQFTYIIMLLIYTAVFQHKKPRLYESASIICAFAGIFLIATHGSIHSLAVSRPALIFGLLSAAGFTIYCLFPHKLYSTYGTTPVIGWAAVISAAVLSACMLLTGRLSLPHMSAAAVCASVGVAIVGTLIPFTVYGIGIEILGSVKASLFVTVEPVISAILTWLIFGTRFTAMDICGFLLILGAVQLVAVLTFKNNK